MINCIQFYWNVNTRDKIHSIDYNFSVSLNLENLITGHFRKLIFLFDHCINCIFKKCQIECLKYLKNRDLQYFSTLYLTSWNLVLKLDNVYDSLPCWLEMLLKVEFFVTSRWVQKLFCSEISYADLLYISFFLSFKIKIFLKIGPAYFRYFCPYSSFRQLISFYFCTILENFRSIDFSFQIKKFSLKEIRIS